MAGLYAEVSLIGGLGTADGRTLMRVRVARLTVAEALRLAGTGEPEGQEARVAATWADLSARLRDEEGRPVKALPVESLLDDDLRLLLEARAALEREVSSFRAGITLGA